MKNLCITLISAILMAPATLLHAQGALPDDVRADTLSRIAPVNRNDLDDYGKRVYDRVIGKDRATPMYGPGGLSMHMPRVADGMDLINQYLRYDSLIGRAYIETAILVAAREIDQQYEWAAHEPAALNEGVSQATVDAIKFHRTVDGLSPEDSLIIRYGRELFRENRLSSGTWAEAVSLFGQQGALEIAAIMADYAMAGILLHAIDQQIPADRPARLPVD